MGPRLIAWTFEHEYRAVGGGGLVGDNAEGQGLVRRGGAGHASAREAAAYKRGVG